MPSRHPVSPLPPVLAGTDADAFTRHSITTRLPGIIDETIRANADALPPGAVAALEKLKSDIASNRVLTPLGPDQKETAWRNAPQPWEAASWLSAPWFYVENYMYRRILDITIPVGITDPFAPAKQAALRAGAAAFVSTVLPLFSGTPAATAAERTALLRAALLRSLWGNRADLSLSSGKVVAPSSADTEHDAFVLCDDASTMIAHLASAPPALINIVLDNCGLEALTDIVLAVLLLTQGFASRVRFICKASPVFVSDAMVVDVHSHVAFLQTLGEEEPAHRAALHAFHACVCEAFRDGRLSAVEHEFFTSPAPMWEAPDDLTAWLREARVTLFKGDANYRRLLGDRHWPHDTPFTAATAYAPAALFAMRTCKAGLICGITREAEAAAVDRHPSDWLVSGTYGVLQFNPGPAAGTE